ncbi:hypothetical protein HN51_016741, partial [Arachis hypogaea]
FGSCGFAVLIPLISPNSSKGRHASRSMKILPIVNEEGMSYHVFVVYAYVVAAILLLPAPFISSRSRVLPPLTLPLATKIAFLGFIGYMQI